MPTYEYQCKTCGSVFDMFQSITASPLRKTQCETCGAVRPVTRLIGTGGAVLFKGSGFYQTDYRSAGYKKAAESESKPADGDSAKKDKSETKTDTNSKPSNSGEPKSSTTKKE